MAIAVRFQEAFQQFVAFMQPAKNAAKYAKL